MMPARAAALLAELGQPTVSPDVSLNQGHDPGMDSTEKLVAATRALQSPDRLALARTVMLAAMEGKEGLYKHAVSLPRMTADLAAGLRSASKEALHEAGLGLRHVGAVHAASVHEGNSPHVEAADGASTGAIIGSESSPDSARIAAGNASIAWHRLLLSCGLPRLYSPAGAALSVCLREAAAVFRDRKDFSQRTLSMVEGMILASRSFAAKGLLGLPKEAFMDWLGIWGHDALSPGSTPEAKGARATSGIGAAVMNSASKRSENGEQDGDRLQRSIEMMLGEISDM